MTQINKQLTAFLIAITLLLPQTLFATGGGCPPEGCSPAPSPDKITDLRVTASSDHTLTLEWTTPSFGSGSQSQRTYNVYIFNQSIWGGSNGNRHDAILLPTENNWWTGGEWMTVALPTEVGGTAQVPNPWYVDPTVIYRFSNVSHPDIVPDAKNSGEPETMTLKFLANDVNFHIRIRAVNFLNATSFSNEATGIPASQTQEATEDEDDDDEGTQESQAPPTSGSNIGGGGIQPRKASFSGRVFPDGNLELEVKNVEGSDVGHIADTFVTVEDDGTFLATAEPLLAKDYFFSLRGTDKDGRKTGIVAFPADFTSLQSFSKEDIFFPPTVGFEEGIITTGDNITVEGYGLPYANISIELDRESIGETKAGGDGAYTYTTTSAALSSGEHQVKVKQTDTNGVESLFSQTQTLRISSITIPEADFNGDNTINIIDWSVFLTAWGSNDSAQRERADMDGDGTIGISDFAIFLEALVVE